MSSRILPSSQAPSLPWQRPSLFALIAAGAVLAIAVLAPSWLVRPALIGALALGVVAAVLAVRGYRRLDETLRTEAGEKLLVTVRRHRAESREERERTSGVLQTLRGQIERRDQVISSLDQRVAEQGRTLVERERGLGRLRTERDGLRAELSVQAMDLESLRTTLAAKDAEIALLQAAVDDDAELYAMPRRGRAQGNRSDALAEAATHVTTEDEIVDVPMLQSAYGTGTDERDRRQA